jgi:hypothetical protein
MPDVTIPADHAERFKREAAEGFEERAQSRAKLATADRLCEQVHDERGELRVEADRESLTWIIEGCLLESVEEGC